MGMNNVLTRSIIVIAVLALGCAIARADEVPDYFQKGMGARAASTGGAGVADIDAGYDAVYFNPALLATGNNSLLGLSFHSFTDFDLETFSAGFKKPNVSKRLGIGLLFHRSSVSNILKTTPVFDDTDGSELPSGVTFDGTYGSLENGMILGFAYDELFTKYLTGGLSLKYHRLRLDDYSHSKLYGIDLGLLYHKPGTRLSIGLNAQNILGFDLKPYAKPELNLKTGLTYKLKNTTLFLDRDSNVSGGAALHTGLEYNIFSGLSLRAGVLDGDITAGMGISSGKFKLDLVRENTDYGYVHRFSLTFLLGSGGGASQEKDSSPGRETGVKPEAEKPPAKPRLMGAIIDGDRCDVNDSISEAAGMYMAICKYKDESAEDRVNDEEKTLKLKLKYDKADSVTAVDTQTQSGSEDSTKCNFTPQGCLGTVCAIDVVIDRKSLDEAFTCKTRFAVTDASGLNNAHETPGSSAAEAGAESGTLVVLSYEPAVDKAETVAHDDDSSADDRDIGGGLEVIRVRPDSQKIVPVNSIIPLDFNKGLVMVPIIDKRGRDSMGADKNGRRGIEVDNPFEMLMRRYHLEPGDASISFGGNKNSAKEGSTADTGDDFEVNVPFKYSHPFNNYVLSLLFDCNSAENCEVVSGKRRGNIDDIEIKAESESRKYIKIKKVRLTIEEGNGSTETKIVTLSKPAVIDRFEWQLPNVGIDDDTEIHMYRFFMPFRDVFELIGFEVEWINPIKSMFITSISGKKKVLENTELEMGSSGENKTGPIVFFERQDQGVHFDVEKIVLIDIETVRELFGLEASPAVFSIRNVHLVEITGREKRAEDKHANTAMLHDGYKVEVQWIGGKPYAAWPEVEKLARKLNKMHTAEQLLSAIKKGRKPKDENE